MGLFDHNVENSFERIFDFDRDGNLDPFEMGMMFEFLENGGVFPGTGNNTDPEDDG